MTDKALASADMSTKPKVFILDLDGTLVGNMTSILVYHDIVDLVNVRANTNGHAVLPCDTARVLQDAFVNGMARPGFLDFYERNKDAKFFIYTAAATMWARFVIDGLEKHWGVKFQRPLFTREDCIRSPTHIRYVKVVDMVLPRIEKSLGHTCDRNSITIIDDLPEAYVPMDRHLVFMCPCYMYGAGAVDVLEMLPKHIVLQYFNKILEVLENHMNMQFDLEATRLHKSFMRQYRKHMWSYKVADTFVEQDTWWKNFEFTE